MKETIIIIVGITLFFTLFLSGLFLFDMNVKCPKFGTAVERPYKYVLFGGGCFVQDMDGRWVLDKNYWNSPQSPTSKNY